MKCFALLLIMPAVGMVTASFFVAFAASKTDSKGLKNYARFVIALLGIAAVAIICGVVCKFIFAGGCSTLGSGRYEPFCPM
ncbi:MAG: hypothetical protein Q8L26_03090 [Candidatus Omnitrophota bacterium]|nr:hypothetical protein [Candidatus Omnitrophota bacterium]